MAALAGGREQEEGSPGDDEDDRCGRPQEDQTQIPHPGFGEKASSPGLKSFLQADRAISNSA